jgi:hypothetical protein
MHYMYIGAISHNLNNILMGNFFPFINYVIYFNLFHSCNKKERETITIAFH